MANLNVSELSGLLNTFQALQDHHDPATPTQLDLGKILQGLLGGGNSQLSGLLGFVIGHPEIVALIVGLLKSKKGALPPTQNPIDGHPTAPPAVVPPTRPRQAQGQIIGIASWVEEAWHDWFRNDPLTTHPGEDSDWAEGGSPIMGEILSGKRPLPPGARVRFMAEELPAGSGAQGNYVIEHVFEIDGKEYAIRSDSGEADQPGAPLFNVVRGPRFRAGKGWDVAIQFHGFDGAAKKLTYFARSAEDPSIAGKEVSLTLAHK